MPDNPVVPTADLGPTITPHPGGHRSRKGRLVVVEAGYRILINCAKCRIRKNCHWYTGYGNTIRWFCDGCVGSPPVYIPDLSFGVMDEEQIEGRWRWAPDV